MRDKISDVIDTVLAAIFVFSTLGVIGVIVYLWLVMLGVI